MKAVERRKTLAPKPPKEGKRAHSAVVRTLLRESDRGAVLVGAAFVEHSLALALRTIFDPETERAAAARDTLFSRRGPFSSGWAKTQFALAAGVIDERMYEGIELIRVLRNHFAHSHSRVTFTDSEAQKAVRGLRRLALSSADERRIIRQLLPHRTKPVRAFRARIEFVATLSYIVGYLHGWVDRQAATD
jgi:mannitol repressor